MGKSFDRYDYYESGVEYRGQSSMFMVLMLIVVIALVGYSVYEIFGEFSIVIDQQDSLKAKVSWYWPPLLGTNCAVARNGKCVSRMASGLPWENWVDRAAACPKEFAFGTEFIIDGEKWVCLDRGGAIKRINDNLIWLDLLTNKPDHKYGTIVDVTVITK